MNKDSFTSVIIMHGMLALTLPLFLWLLVGCIKSPKISPVELGPQATETELERTISKVLYGIDPWKIEVQQDVVYEFNMRIENQEEIKPIAQLTQTVLSREEIDNNTLRVIFKEREYDYNTGEEEVRETPPKDYKRGGAQPTYISLALELSPLDQLNDQMAIFSDDKRKPIRVTYHKLNFSEASLEPPRLVKERNNCGDVPNCILRSSRLSYDEVNWYSDVEYEISKWSFIISRDAPYLSYILERCLASMIPSNGRRFYVRQCQFAKNFHYR